METLNIGFLKTWLAGLMDVPVASITLNTRVDLLRAILVTSRPTLVMVPRSVATLGPDEIYYPYLTSELLALFLFFSSTNAEFPLISPMLQALIDIVSLPTPALTSGVTGMNSRLEVLANAFPIVGPGY
jgi:hypothetical protein